MVSTAHGISARGIVWWNLSPAALYEHALAAGDGSLAEGGPLVVSTGAHTGRSPKDKFVVREPGSEDRIWWGAINQPIDRSQPRRASAPACASTSAQHPTST